MDKNWFPLQGIPPDGKTFVLEEQAQWEAPLKEFGITGCILEPLRAEIFVLPQEQGVLFRGNITGKVVVSCDRCADDSEVVVKHNFDSFETYPADGFGASGKDNARKSAERGGREAESPLDEDDLPDDADEAVIRQAAHGRGIEINPGALAWQEFTLALPVKPLCREACKGLCPTWGANKNTEVCS